jgi:hypothetical protein
MTDGSGRGFHEFCDAGALVELVENVRIPGCWSIFMNADE